MPRQTSSRAQNCQPQYRTAARNERAGLMSEMNEKPNEELEKIRERKALLVKIMKEKEAKAVKTKAAWTKYIAQFQRDTMAFDVDYPEKLTVTKQKDLERLLRGYESHFAKDLKERAGRTDLIKPKGRRLVVAPTRIDVVDGMHSFFSIKKHHTIGLKLQGETFWTWFHPDEDSEGDLKKNGFSIARKEGYEYSVDVTLDESMKGKHFYYVVEERDEYKPSGETEGEEVELSMSAADWTPTEPDEKTDTEAFDGVTDNEVSTDPFAGGSSKTAVDLDDDPEVYDREASYESSNSQEPSESSETEEVPDKALLFQHAQALSLGDEKSANLIVQDLETLSTLSDEDAITWQAIIHKYVAVPRGYNEAYGTSYDVKSVADQTQTTMGRLLRDNRSVAELIDIYKEEQKR